MAEHNSRRVLALPCTQGDGINNCFGTIDIVVECHTDDAAKILKVAIDKSTEIFCERCGEIYETFDGSRCEAAVLISLKPTGKKKSKSDLIRVAVRKNKMTFY